VHRQFRGGIIWLLVVCATGVSFGLNRDRNIGQYGHDVWTSQNGLTGEAVYRFCRVRRVPLADDFVRAGAV